MPSIPEHLSMER